MDEERINQLLEKFETMDKDAKEKLTNTYKITMALVGAQIEAIENAKNATKEMENQRQEIVNEISEYGENAILFDSEKRDEQRKRLEEKTSECEKVKEEEEETTKKAVETINGHVDTLKLNIKRQKEQITAKLPKGIEDEKSIKIYYQEKMLATDDAAEVDELEDERNEKLDALKKLKELNELEKAVDSIRNYIGDKVKVNFKEVEKQAAKQTIAQTQTAQQATEQEQTTQQATAQTQTAQQTTAQTQTTKQPTEQTQTAQQPTEQAQTTQQPTAQTQAAQQTTIDRNKRAKEASANALDEAMKRTMLGEEENETKGSKLVYYNVKRDVKGITIDGKLISYKEIDQLPKEIYDKVRQDGNINDETIILAAMALKEKEPDSIDLDQFKQEYGKLTADDRDEKGKRTSKMDLTYDLKIRLRDLLKKETRTELKWLRNSAHEAREYAKVEARGINKLILNRRAHKAAMAEKFPGKEESKKIEAPTEQAKTSKKEEFAKSIDARAAVVKKRATREKTGVKDVSKDKAMADEIAKNVASEIEKEEER